MAVDYEQIAREHRRYYGEGDKHLQIYRRLYADKTHFVYELIQNAEDKQSTQLCLILREKELLVWNDGSPFDEKDVKGICSIGLSEKDFTQIGTFGIGFKAVYAYTDTPEIYSGEEQFRIHRYVEPEGIDIPHPEVEELLREGRTVFRLPFKQKVTVEAIKKRLEALEPHTLLFLRHLKKIIWRDERGGQGSDGNYFCTRISCEGIGSAQRVKLAAQEWLIFHKEVEPPPSLIEQMSQEAEEGEERERILQSGHTKQPVEVAFLLRDEQIVPAGSCVLFAYLPTEKETHLQFLAQARYQTTPARDNVPADSPWNGWLIQETATFLPEVLTILRRCSLLTPSFFEVLPIEGDGIPDTLQPIGQSLQQTLKEGELIPSDLGGFSHPGRIFYPHNEILRKLFDSQDLADLTGIERAAWLHRDIRNTKEQVRRFEVVRAAGVREVQAEKVVSWLIQKNEAWFEQKEDGWIRNIYLYLSGQKVEQERIKRSAIVRLENGRHKCAIREVIFLPSEQAEEGQRLKPFLEELPILRQSLIEGEEREVIVSFLKIIGVMPLRPAEVIRRFLLPQYQQDSSPEEGTNRIHIQYLKDSLEHLSSEEKRVLLEEICHIPLLLAYKGRPVEERRFMPPNRVYLPQMYTGDNDLEIYFSHSADIWFVDQGYCSLEEASDWLDFLKKLGASDVPRKIKNLRDSLTPEEKSKLRGNSGFTREVDVTDWLLDGLRDALKHIERRGDDARDVAQALWRLLVKLLQSYPVEFFKGKYRWSYYKEQSRSFDASFYRQLKKTPWLPNGKDLFYRPSELFTPTTENQALLGSSVFYLHPDFDVSDSIENEPAYRLAEKLGIHLRANTESVLTYLKTLSDNADVDTQTLSRIYRFLSEQGASRKEEFGQHTLIYTPAPLPHWWKSCEVFWEDESAVFGTLRGYLKEYYPENLKPFFISVGVSERAAPLDYVNAVYEVSQNPVDAELFERLYLLYRRLWNAIQDGGNWMESDKWRQVLEEKYWLGRKDGASDFFRRTELTWNDHDGWASLFKRKVPFWAWDDLPGLAKFLKIEGCSQAEVDFQPMGERIPLEEWSNKVMAVADDLGRFLQSPKWRKDHLTETEFRVLHTLTVCLVERSCVNVTLKSQTIPVFDPPASHFDRLRGVIWLVLDSDEEDYPDLIGEALENYFDIHELREFVKDLLMNRNKAISRWNRRGLRSELLPPPDEENEANGKEKKGRSPDEPNGGGSGGHWKGSGKGGGSGGHGGGGGGGEGENHRRLKKLLAECPDCIASGLKLVRTEYPFKSGDAVDILFEDGSGMPVTIEIESNIPIGEETGLWQAVKYKHLAAAEYGVRCEEVRSILIAPNIPEDIKEKCATLGVEPKEIPIPD